MTLHSVLNNKNSDRNYLDYQFKSYELKKDGQGSLIGIEVNFYKLDDVNVIENINHFTVSDEADLYGDNWINADDNWYYLMDTNLNEYGVYAVFRYRLDKFGKEKLKSLISQGALFPGKGFLKIINSFNGENYLSIAADHKGNNNWFYCYSVSKKALSQKVDEFQQIQNKFNEKIKLEIKKVQDSKL